MNLCVLTFLSDANIWHLQPNAFAIHQLSTFNPIPSLLHFYHNLNPSTFSQDTNDYDKIDFIRYDRIQLLSKTTRDLFDLCTFSNGTVSCESWTLCESIHVSSAHKSELLVANHFLAHWSVCTLRLSSLIGLYFHLHACPVYSITDAQSTSTEGLETSAVFWMFDAFSYHTKQLWFITRRIVEVTETQLYSLKPVMVICGFCYTRWRPLCITQDCMDSQHIGELPVDVHA